VNRLRVGISPCPNDIFIFAGLILGTVDAPDMVLEFDYQDVQTLNEAAQNDAYEVVKLSYAAYPAVADRYALLECGGALGRGVGPLLLRHGGGAFDPEQSVLVPGAQTTANFLLDHFLQRPVQKRFLPFDALYDMLRGTPGAQGVVIHEKRFTFADDDLTLLADLGEHWERTTGHAIPLGGIAVRRDRDALRPDIARSIRESLRWSHAHRDEALSLCRHHAQDLTDGVIEAHIGLYVNDYSDDLGDDGRAAVAHFLAAAGAN
jgi:1,4-dihydroxy-6-naphthoate synthase